MHFLLFSFLRSAKKLTSPTQHALPRRFGGIWSALHKVWNSVKLFKKTINYHSKHLKDVKTQKKSLNNADTTLKSRTPLDPNNRSSGVSLRAINPSVFRDWPYPGFCHLHNGYWFLLTFGLFILSIQTLKDF